MKTIEDIFTKQMGEDFFRTMTNQQLRSFYAGVNEVIEEVKTQMKPLVKLLKEYDKWEGKMIAEDECWGPDGMNAYPTLTPELFDELLELQHKRAKVLSKLKKQKA